MAQPSRNKIENIVRKALRFDLRKIPPPLPGRAIEVEEAFFMEVRKELNREERIPFALLMDHARERQRALRIAVQGSRDELVDVLDSKRSEGNLSHEGITL